MQVFTARRGDGVEVDRETAERVRELEGTHTRVHTHMLLQEPISEISKKGLGSDWVDSSAVITYRVTVLR